MPIDVHIKGNFPQADFARGRAKAMARIKVVGTAIATQSAPKKSGTLQGAMRGRMLAGGQGVHIGIFGKSDGFYGRFVEFGHASKRFAGYRMSKKKSNKQGPRRAKNVIDTGKRVRAHPFFFDRQYQAMPGYLEIITDELEDCVTMEAIK